MVPSLIANTNWALESFLMRSSGTVIRSMRRGCEPQWASISLRAQNYLKLVVAWVRICSSSRVAAPYVLELTSRLVRLKSRDIDFAFMVSPATSCFLMVNAFLLQQRLLTSSIQTEFCTTLLILKERFGKFIGSCGKVGWLR